MTANPLALEYKAALATDDVPGVQDAAGLALLEQCEFMLKGRVNRFTATRPWLREDVTAQANETVLSAARSWDETKGPFVSYAKDAVTYKLIDLVETSGTLHIPRRMRDAARKDPERHPDPVMVDVDSVEIPETLPDFGDAETFEQTYMEDMARVCGTSYPDTLASRLVDPIVTRTVFGPVPAVTFE